MLLLLFVRGAEPEEEVDLSDDAPVMNEQDECDGEPAPEHDHSVGEPQPPDGGLDMKYPGVGLCPRSVLDEDERRRRAEARRAKEGEVAWDVMGGSWAGR